MRGSIRRAGRSDAAAAPRSAGGTREATATALADHVPISRQAVAKHLAVLDDAELVAAHRRGREVLYAVRPARIAATAGWLARVASDWERRLESIKRIAEADDSH